MNSLIILSIIIISYLLTEMVRRYAIKNNFLDRPNERSSHKVPTPGGGGVSIVFLFLFTIIFASSLPSNIIIALVGAGSLVAIIGFVDDKKHVAAKWRLLIHFLASIWVLYWLGQPPDINVFDYIIGISYPGYIVALFLLVWLLNLFNFMDGIDGLAASETIFISCAAAYYSWISGNNELSFILLVLAASTAGFLIVNWPPAKIFMGDVGSGFLGLTIGSIAYATIMEGATVWYWLILSGVFLIDSGVTLIRRIINGDKWYEAHCSHAYQHAARQWGHKKVTLSVILINLFWLLPLSFAAYTYPHYGFLITFLAFMPLILVVKKFKAGLN